VPGGAVADVFQFDIVVQAGRGGRMVCHQRESLALAVRALLTHTLHQLRDERVRLVAEPPHGVEHPLACLGADAGRVSQDAGHGHGRHSRPGGDIVQADGNGGGHACVIITWNRFCRWGARVVYWL
jgi:hypothetical protein